jgi:uncharacterized protein
MLKFLLVLLVVGIWVWSLAHRGCAGRASGGGRQRIRQARLKRPPAKCRSVVVECAHCGLHLPASRRRARDTVAILYCSDAHRRLGPARPPQE